ncbi:MAG: T9SS type A sorting domain-containing protein [Bacteroidales bacterium]|nr:T9SS type A sorting domain-containing protein [Bacteroidales bacterium]
MKRLLLLTLSCAPYLGLFAQVDIHQKTDLPVIPILRAGEQTVNTEKNTNGRRLDNPDLPVIPILKSGEQNDGRRLDNPDLPVIPILRSGEQNNGRRLDNPDLPVIPILKSGEQNDGRRLDNPDLPVFPILRADENGRRLDNPDLPVFPILRSGDQNDGRRLDNPDLPVFPILRADENGRRLDNPDLPAFPILKSNDTSLKGADLPIIPILRALQRADEMKYDSLVVYSNSDETSVIQKVLPVYENNVLTSIKYYNYTTEGTDIFSCYFNERGLLDRTDYFVVNHKTGAEVKVNSIVEETEIVGGLVVEALSAEGVMYVDVDDFNDNMIKSLEVVDATSDTYIQCFYSPVADNASEIAVEENEIELKGNFVETSLEVVSNVESTCKYQIVSMNGSLMKQGYVTLGSNDIDLSNLTTGSYILAVSTPNGLNSNRIIKQ